MLHKFDIFPSKKNIHIFRQSALKMLMPQFEKKIRLNE